MAAYCRVSTDKEDQANSFESQKRYFEELIHQQPGWQLAQIYADEGISGTSTKKRAAFHQRLQDARARRFDRLLTKEVSRFSRNILDTIAYTRELRHLGIGVVFLTDGIDTLEPDAELRLSILGSIAQEESRKTSTRVKWGQTRRMEQGVVFGRSLLGYDVRGGQLFINPEGAKTVQLIFHKYVLEHKGAWTIARELQDAGLRTLTGSTQWRNSGVLKILKNEKYCGDLKQKKTFTPDYLSHQKKYNHGEEPFVYLRDHHQPIVSREIWEAAQREMARRDLTGSLGQGHGNRYPLSGKVWCGLCGKSFVSRNRKRRDGSSYRLWRCRTAAEQGKPRRDPAGNPLGCSMDYHLSDQAAFEAVKNSIGMLSIDRDRLAKEITALVQQAVGNVRQEGQWALAQLEGQQAQLQQKKAAVLDAFFSQNISQEDMELMNREYDRQLQSIAQKREALPQQKGFSAVEGQRESLLMEALDAILGGTGDAPEFYGHLLDHITALPGKTWEVHLKLLPGAWVYTLAQGQEHP